MPPVRTSAAAKREQGEAAQLLEVAKNAGLTKQVQKFNEPPKLSLLQRVGRGLSAFETSDALYGSLYQDKPFLLNYAKNVVSGLGEMITGREVKGVAPKKTFKDILVYEGMRDRPGKLDAVDIAGLAGDILTDPTTFIGGELGKGVLKGTSVLMNGAEKLPLIGTTLQAARMGAEELFKPFAKMSRLGETGQKQIDSYLKFVKSTAAETDDFLNTVAEKAKLAEQVHGKGAGKVIAETVEKGPQAGRISVSELSKAKNASLAGTEKVGGIERAKKELLAGTSPPVRVRKLEDGSLFIEDGRHRLAAAKELKLTSLPFEDVTKQYDKTLPGIESAVSTTGNKFLDDIMNDLVAGQEARKVVEKEKGILTRELPNYLHHMLTPEAREAFDKGVDFSGFTKPLSVKLGAGKERKLEGTISEINKAFKEKHGFNLFEEDAFTAFAKRGVDSIRAVKTYDYLQETAARIGRKSDKDFIEDGIRWTEAASPQLKGFRFPQPITKHLDETVKVLTNDEATNKFLGLFDKVQNFWKKSVTGYFPAFHTRNALSGLFNNWIAGINDPTVYTTAENLLRGGKATIVTKGGKRLAAETIMKEAKDYGLLGQTGFFDVRKALKERVSPSAYEKLANAPMKVMGAIENRLRLPLFIDGLKKGMSFEDAAKRVMKFHFDYAPEGMTFFEQKVMRRIIPFYTWSRHNIPLQIEQLLLKPGKYASVFKAQRATGLEPGGEEENVLPTWLREQITFKGDSGYWSGLGLPFEEATQKLSKPLRGIGISLSPLIKTPLEQLTGYNIFKERRIEEDNYAKQYKFVPAPIKQWLEFKEHKTKDGGKYYTVNPHKKYWLELIGARGLSTALRLSQTPEDKKNITTLIIPMRLYNYSIDDLKRWAETDKMNQIEKALLNAGLIRKFEKTYVPKK